MSKKSKEIERDQNGVVIMSLNSIRICCEKEDFFNTPELNDQLFLQYKGFHQINNLQKFVNVKALWLNNNAISAIRNLDYNIQLVTLNLNNNLIKKIENLDQLVNLTILNLSHNKIETVENLHALKKLNSLNLANNLLTNNESIQKICECQTISNLDLSNNQLTGEESILAIFQNMPNLTCLYLRNTPIVRSVKFYRKKFISGLPILKCLDDRPLFDSERRLAEAWKNGGTQLQNIEKIKLFEEQQKKNRRNFEDFEKLADPPRQKRRQIFQALSSEKKQLLQRLYFKREEYKQQPELYYAQLVDTCKQIQNIESYLKKLEEACSSIGVTADSKPSDYLIQQVKDKVIIINRTQILYLESNLIASITEELSQASEMNPINEVQQQQGCDQNKNKIQQKNIKNNESQQQQQQQKEQQQQQQIWNPKFDQILELLLEKYKFDFSEATQQLNSIILNINDRVNKNYKFYSIERIRQIWSKYELSKNKTIFTTTLMTTTNTTTTNITNMINPLDDLD